MATHTQTHTQNLLSAHLHNFYSWNKDVSWRGSKAKDNENEENQRQNYDDEQNCTNISGKKKNVLMNKGTTFQFRSVRVVFFFFYSLFIVCSFTI